MAPSRPRRTVLRRALPIVALLVLVPTASAMFGPELSARLGPAGPPSAAPSVAAGSAASPAAGASPRAAPSASASQRPSGPVGVQAPRVVHDPARAAVRLALKVRLDGIRAKYGIPGVSVTIIFPDGSQWFGAAGLADVGAGVPVTHETAFAVASISKTFTSALVLALVEDGSVRLEAPAATYLPDLGLDSAVTVRHLLDHTSGLRDYFFHRDIDRLLLAHPNRRWTASEALQYVGKPYFKPGRGWHYSNTNYLLLGLLAERVGGAPLADQLRARFFGPLGLDGTFYQPTDEPTRPVAHGYRFGTGADARPLDLTGDGSIVPFASVVTAAAGAGGIAATSSDIARWARALYGGGVLAPATLRMMLDDAARTERFRPTVPYGLGVQSVEVAGEATLGHSGRLLGSRAVVRYLPESGFTVAVLTNQSRTDPAIIARALLRIAMAPARDCPCLDVGRER
ncbi:MAG: serine hydrolase domain-containing protein [Chloroflexota bacterium]